MDDLCSAAPTVMVIDDLQWADDAVFGILWHQLAGSVNQLRHAVVERGSGGRSVGRGCRTRWPGGTSLRVTLVEVKQGEPYGDESPRPSPPDGPCPAVRHGEELVRLAEPAGVDERNSAKGRIVPTEPRLVGPGTGLEPGGGVNSSMAWSRRPMRIKAGAPPIANQNRGAGSKLTPPPSSPWLLDIAVTKRRRSVSSSRRTDR